MDAVDAETLARLDRETAKVYAELTRTETKAGHLLTLAVAALMMLAAVGPGRHLQPTLTRAGVLADLTAVGLLGLVLFPRMGRRLHGWLAHTRRTWQQILRHVASENREEELAKQLEALTRLAAWKFRLIQAAEVALGTAVLLVLAAAVV